MGTNVSKCIQVISKAEQRFGYSKTGSGRSELINLIHIYYQNMLLHYSLSVTNDLTRELFTEVYTCQLFLRYRREIFILGVLGFWKTARSFPMISEDVRSLPKKSEVFRSLSKTYKREKLELALSSFHFKHQRSRGRYCHLFILHMVFVPYMGLS